MCCCGKNNRHLSKKEMRHVEAHLFISLISPRKKLAVFLFFENDYSLHDFLARGLPHQQALSVAKTLFYIRTCENGANAKTHYTFQNRICFRSFWKV